MYHILQALCSKIRVPVFSLFLGESFLAPNHLHQYSLNLLHFPLLFLRRVDQYCRQQTADTADELLYCSHSFPIQASQILSSSLLWFKSICLLSKGFTWTETPRALSVSGIIKVFHMIYLFFHLHALLYTPPHWRSWSPVLPAAQSLLEPPLISTELKKLRHCPVGAPGTRRGRFRTNPWMLFATFQPVSSLRSFTIHSNSLSLSPFLRISEQAILIHSLFPDLLTNSNHSIGLLRDSLLEKLGYHVDKMLSG